MTTVPEVVRSLHDHLGRAAIPHAFGGAIALAYAVPEPRATIDVDLNVFVDTSEAARAFAALPGDVQWSDDDVTLAVRDGQVRVWWDDVAIDLFFDYHPFHEDAARGALEVPFGEVAIPVLAADHLAVFKAFFNRTKDWADIESMVEGGALDRRFVEGWLRRLLGPDDERLERLAATFATAAQAAPPVPRLPPLG